MKILNDGLPQPVYDWIVKTQGQYSKGDADMSVTELINPPRIRVLKKRLWEQIEVKASSLLNVTIGNTIHDAIEASSTTGVSERRLSLSVLDWKVSGGMDHWEDGILSDWKTCNKWKTLLCDNGVIDEYEKQLNVYAQILRVNKIPVTRAKIFAIFKDWNRGELNQNLKKGHIFKPSLQNGYPEKEWLYFDLRLWSEEEATEYIHGRVILHQEAEEHLPLCPEKELWGGRRCSDYCDVSFGCDQYKNKKQKG